MKKLSLMLMLLPSFVFAKEFICPKTFRSIKVGSTAQQVIANCGAPVSKKQGLRSVTEAQDVVQWMYTGNPDQRAASLTPSIMFTLQDRKVIAVTVAGQQVQSTNLCNSGRVVGVGADDIELRQACGAPNFINQSTNQTVAGFVKYQEWVIDQGPYKPKLIIQFEKGKVTNIQTR